MHACKESVTVLPDKKYIYLKGEGRSNTIVAWKSIGSSFQEAVLMVLADNFIAQGISFKVMFQEIHPKYISLFVMINVTIKKYKIKEKTPDLHGNPYGKKTRAKEKTLL